MQEGAGYGTIIRQEISELSAQSLCVVMQLVLFNELEKSFATIQRLKKEIKMSFKIGDIQIDNSWPQWLGFQTLLSVLL